MKIGSKFNPKAMLKKVIYVELLCIEKKESKSNIHIYLYRENENTLSVHREV